MLLTWRSLNSLRVNHEAHSAPLRTASPHTNTDFPWPGARLRSGMSTLFLMWGTGGYLALPVSNVTVWRHSSLRGDAATYLTSLTPGARPTTSVGC
jgi:hypothetical protein